MKMRACVKIPLTTAFRLGLDLAAEDIRQNRMFLGRAGMPSFRPCAGGVVGGIFRLGGGRSGRMLQGIRKDLLIKEKLATRDGCSRGGLMGDI
jgi:hypothetical protein